MRSDSIFNSLTKAMFTQRYGTIFKRIVRVSSPAAAEMTKLLENILAAYDFGAVDTLGGVSRVDYELGLAHNALEVVVRMVGDDHGAIAWTEIVQRGALHLQVVFAAFAYRGEEGIVIADFRSLGLQ